MLFHFGNLGVEGLLDVQAFYDSFDDPVAIRKPLHMVFDVAWCDKLCCALRHKGRGLGLEHFLDRAFSNGISIFAILGHDIQEHYGDPGVGDMGGNPSPHNTCADHRSFTDFAHYKASRTVAIPWPPPMHCVARAYLLPSRCMIWAALPVIRAPVAPSGCPRAIAPPSILTLLRSSPRS